MPTLDNANDALPDGVKIKQEKITPPATPNHAALSITDDLLDNILDRKPVAEPIQSSDDILADLFKVFNAAPPKIDSDTSKDATHKKKKHKKEKKVKKHKKRSRESDTNPSDEDGHKSKARKAKKSKRHDGEPDAKRKRHKSSKEREIKVEKLDDNVKKEKTDSASKSVDNVVKSQEAEKSDKSQSVQTNPPRDLDIQVSVSKDDGVGGKRKIVIKSLVNSTVYQDTLKEVNAKQKEKDEEKLKRKEKDRERERTKDRTRDREKRKQPRRRTSKERDRRDRSHSSSLSLSDEETYLRERERERHDRDKDKDDFYGDYRRDLDRDSDRRRHRSRNGFYRHDHDRRRSRSSSRHRHDRSSNRIDKKRLLEIARKNAISMLKNGTLPGANNLDPEAKERALTKMRYGGKSVDELTEFCKKLSKGEANGYLSNISGDSDIDADLEKPFHHPFIVKDRGPIVMNIKNATPIPPKTAEQTKAILMQFPVSSGTHHRLNESEWVPVVPTKPSKKDKDKDKDKDKEEQPTDTTSTLKVKDATATTSKTTSKSTTSDVVPLPTTDYGYQTSVFQQEVAPVSYAPAVPKPAPPAPAPTDNIFAEKSAPCDLDVTSIITKRLNAMRKLQDNPMDSEAIKLMYRTQKDMSSWASSKFVPGQFTGSTGANILSTKELASGFQAWAKRDQLIATQPVSGGMGMHLLQKMGWKPGEGLGKEKNGSLQPLLLEVKLDKKGLVAEEESPQAQRLRAQNAKKAKAVTLAMAKQNFESKHPVSLLGELSAKRKLGLPTYQLVMQEGPSHQRQFLYSVEVNGQTFQPNITSLNKKEAKSNAAKCALQRMGYLPDVPMPQPVQAPQIVQSIQPMQPPQPVPPPQSYIQPPINAMNFNEQFAPPNSFH